MHSGYIAEIDKGLKVVHSMHVNSLHNTENVPYHVIYKF